MNSYDITVLYAYHAEKERPVQDFPRQTLPAEKIQIIPVWENDIYRPHKNCLEKVSLAEGTFTILLDEGDSFSERFLERMLQAASHPEMAFAMPALQSQKPLRRGEYFLLRDVEDLEVNIQEEPAVFPANLYGLLIRTSLLKEALLSTAFPCEAEKQALLYILGRIPRFRYLGTEILSYATSLECDHEYDIRCHTLEWYYEPFQKFLLPYLEQNGTTKDTALLTQLYVIYMIKTRIGANEDNRNKHVISREEAENYCQLFSKALQYVSMSTLLRIQKVSHTARLHTRRLLLFLRLKKQDFSYYPKIRCTKEQMQLISDGEVFCELEQIPLRIIKIDYIDEKLEIDGTYNDFFSQQDAEVFARFGKREYPLVYNGRYARTKCFGVTYARMKTFHVSIPVEPSKEERILNFIFKVQGNEYIMDYSFPAHTSRFAKDFGYIYWRIGTYLSFWSRKGIHVVQSSKWKILKKEVALWLQMWKKKDGFYREQLPLKILNFLLQPYFTRQKIWLFMDKIYKGGDSSEYMYRYAIRQKDGIKKYYLLDKTSADYARMKAEGFRPLVRNSLKHRLVFLNADMVIASNSTVFSFNGYTFARSLPIRGNVHFDVACVQHGMSVQKIAIAQQRLRDNTNLYFCASKYEIQNLSKPEYDYMGYDALKLTGVPRYDGLKNRAQKILVISPTWRMQSALPPTGGTESVSRTYNPNFKETSYYKVYNGLINDPRLLGEARKYGYRIQYVLHPIVSPQKDDFVQNDLVEIIPSIGEMSYEKIFCEGALMVTDFSGVQFDFAYMRKPVIYLHHHDIPQHYEEGAFFYDTMGFGEICHTNDELIDVLCRYMKNDCQMPDLYRSRADDFFAFSDHHNCERIYPVMLEHEKKRTR